MIKEPVHVTDQTFEKAVLQYPLPILVDFWAPWCGPCKMVAPILNEIAEEQQGKVRVGKVNVDNQQALATKFKVRNIPTLVLLKNGKEVKRFVGVKSKKTLLEGIAEF